MPDPDIKKPPEADSLAAETSEGSDQAARLSARLNRYSNAKKRALENLIEIDNTIPDDIDQSAIISRTHARLKTCATFLEFHQYYTVGRVKLIKANFCCQPLICPLCAMRKASKQITSYLEKYQQILKENPDYKMSMVTLTVKNGDDLLERFNHLQKSMKVLFSRRRDYLKKGRGKTQWRKIYGWVGSFEVTNRGMGWHPHAHIMVLHTGRLDWEAMRLEWAEITQDSHILNVSPARHLDKPEEDFMEVFKYTLKFSELTPSQNVEAYFRLKGKRLLFSGGCFRGVQVQEHLEDIPLDDLPYIELIYRYTPVGYSLSPYEPPTSCPSSRIKTGFSCNG